MKLHKKISKLNPSPGIGKPKSNERPPPKVAPKVKGKKAPNQKVPIQKVTERAKEPSKPSYAENHSKTYYIKTKFLLKTIITSNRFSSSLK